jgi:hypothetical protein
LERQNRQSPYHCATDNTDGVLRKEIRGWKYTEALQYHQHITLLNNLLKIMNRNKVDDRELIDWCQGAMYATGKESIKKTRIKWIEHKNAPENNTKNWTFEQAIDYILAMESATREGAPQGTPHGHEDHPDGDQHDQGGSRRNKNKREEKERNAQDQGRGYRNGKTPEEKWGDKCPNKRCQRREHGKAKMDLHLKECRYKQKPTQTNLTRFKTLKNLSCNGVKIVKEEYDYIPIMPMTLLAKLEGNRKGKVAKGTNKVETLVFFDSGSKKLLINKDYAGELVAGQGFTKRRGQRYRVNGVEESGNGVICDQYIDLYFLMGETPILQCALIVAGLPERLIAGRETMQTLSLTLANGPTPRKLLGEQEVRPVSPQRRKGRTQGESLQGSRIIPHVNQGRQGEIHS